MQSFGLEIDESALLAGVSRSQKLYDLFLKVIESLVEVLEALGLAAHDGLIQGRIYQDLVAHVELHVAELIHAPVIEMSSMGGMRTAPHQAGNQNNLAAGTGLINAACSALVACKVAWTIGTQSTSIIRWRIHDLVSIGNHMIPTP